MKKQTLVHAVVTTMLSINLSAHAASNTAPVMEKCYGIVKAGKNDCAIPNGNACTARIKTDSDPKAWIFVPKGTCDKIVGASTSPKE